MKPLIILFIFLCSAVIVSCEDSGLEVIRKYPTPYILNTDETGKILGGDRSDWCGTYGMTHGPLYPNPANNVLHGNFSVPQTSFVNIYFQDTTGFQTIMFRDTLNAGYYSINTEVTPYMRQQWILKLYVNIGNQLCTGDVQFY